MDEGKRSSLNAAADRVFRGYYRHCQDRDQDTLFNLLTALHSFNDKLPKESRMFDSWNFVGLKALRNLFHHHEELLHKVKIIAASELPMTCELAQVTLVANSSVERASSLPRESQPDTVRGAFRRYGDVCDIEPAIFNVVVDVFEKVQSLGLGPTSEEFDLVRQSYQVEQDRGIDHRVSGSIQAHAGHIETIFSSIMAMD
ncbi:MULTISPECIES: hypothetical protein [Rhizobium]|uniref:Uncharacterized protein n=1 Tax=Rhizobium esperanzae TaxID=1967781 RepID=A0A7W6Y111_9HYPH|nr:MULTISPECIES: hypothetical protein [Rhizobium]MBB4443495.1 hypothetical protein [Rhizobium esperanzae]MBY5345298.1 hypothetical protein [Rhizobium leguminosarum]MBY5376099.1 hypothetical protein [Rhizobium leguminosarum]MBY5392358.1 hypothetical protein [Rhizobium leguminosarum]MBY5400007.1 hypothetical protein [Rhizobium leguminosarum]